MNISKAQGFILIAGITFSLMVLVQIPDGVFFSGDGGIKYLMVDQIIGGDSITLLEPSDQAPSAEILRLWEMGFFPFAPPFLYPTARGNMFGLPFLFGLITSPFFVLLGFKGLYILPLLALWILWFRWICLGNFLNITPRLISLGLLTLIFATPITLYGNMFWEHTLGILLIFFGIEGGIYLARNNCSKRKSIFLGFLAGLAVWIRPENFILIGILIAGIGFLAIVKRDISSGLFLLSLAGTTVMFFLMNTIIYGHWMGAHGLQIFFVKSRGLGVAFRQYSQISGQLQIEFLKSFPLVLFFLATIPYFVKKRDKLFLFLISFCALFYIMVPAILPGDGGKQWGPRFLLAIIPVILLICIRGLQDTFTQPYTLKKIYISLFIFLMAAGIFQNSIRGTLHVIKDYHHRVLPLLKEITERSESIIIISDPFISQDLAILYREKFFLRIHDGRSLEKLTGYLINHKISGCLYITRKGINHIPPSDTAMKISSNPHFRSEGSYGDFQLYQVQLIP